MVYKRDYDKIDYELHNRKYNGIYDKAYDRVYNKI